MTLQEVSTYSSKLSVQQGNVEERAENKEIQIFISEGKVEQVHIHENSKNDLSIAANSGWRTHIVIDY